MNFESFKHKFIVLDGPDGCGKSTQIRMLADHIQRNGIEVVCVRDPGGTSIGEQIRTILLDNRNAEMNVRCETLLYMASRAQLYGEIIAPALQAGKCVLSDRWVSSTYAYQAVAGKIGPQIVLDIAERVLERAWPDRMILIDVPPEISRTRIGNNPDRMESKSIQFHTDVRNAFLEFARQRDDTLIVDGTQSIEEVHHQIITHLII